MKKFVVAYMSFFEPEIEMETVEADNIVDALKKSSFLKDWYFPDGCSEEYIKNEVFNNDATISVIEI